MLGLVLHLISIDLSSMGHLLLEAAEHDDLKAAKPKPDVPKEKIESPAHNDQQQEDGRHCGDRVPSQQVVRDPRNERCTAPRTSFGLPQSISPKAMVPAETKFGQ